MNFNKTKIKSERKKGQQQYQRETTTTKNTKKNTHTQTPKPAIQFGVNDIVWLSNISTISFFLFQFELAN